MDSTWFKGTRKAIGRTPHLLLGTKSVEDPLITVWTKNISIASTGLTALATAAEHVAERSTSAAQQLRKLVGDFAPIYAAIRDPTLPGSSADDSAPQRILDRRAAIETKLARLDAEVGLKASELAANVKQKVDAARPILKSIETLLTKRSHKKIDYDRIVAARASQAAKTGTTVADLKETNTEEQRLYEDFDARVRKTVPQFFIYFDRFLTGLTLEISKAQTDIARAWLEGAESAARSMGAVSTTNEALKTWRAGFSTIQPAVEALDIIDTTRPLPSRLVDPTPPEHPTHDGFMVRTFHRITGQVVLPRFLGGSLFAGEEAAKELEAESGSTSPPVETLSPRVASPGAAPASRAIVPDAAVAAASPDPSPAPTPKASATAASTNHSVAQAAVPSASPSSVSSTAVAAAPGEWVVAIYPFSGGEGDLTFGTGDRIKVVDHGDEGDTEWWCGSKDGAIGLFPRNYVRAEAVPPVPGRTSGRPPRETLPELPSELPSELPEPLPSEPPESPLSDTKLESKSESKSLPSLPKPEGHSIHAPASAGTAHAESPTELKAEPQADLLPKESTSPVPDPNSQATKEDGILPKPAGDDELL